MPEEKNQAQSEIEKALNELSPPNAEDKQETDTPNIESKEAEVETNPKIEKQPEIKAQPESEPESEPEVKKENSVLNRISSKEKSRGNGEQQNTQEIEKIEEMENTQPESLETEKIKEKLQKAAQKDAGGNKKAQAPEHPQPPTDNSSEIPKQTEQKNKTFNWLPVIISAIAGVLIISGTIFYTLVLNNQDNGEQVEENKQIEQTAPKEEDLENELEMEAQMPTASPSSEPSSSPSASPSANPSASPSAQPSQSPFGSLVQ